MKHTILPDDTFLQTVRPVIENALAECEKVLPSQRAVSVVVNYTEDVFVSKRMGGSTGRSDNGNGFEVSVNTNVEGWERSLASSVAHEYNHVVRHQVTGTEFSSLTVKDNIAVEGLALCFEEEFSGVTPPFAQAVSIEEAKEAWRKLEPHFDELAGDWTARAWIADNDDFPLWAGYTLSYLVIKQAKEQLDLAWSELMRLDTEELVKGI